MVQKTDWKTEEMPVERESFTANVTLSARQIKILKRGNIPRAMEDKWFWYFEDNKLYAHRSWTG